MKGELKHFETFTKRSTVTQNHCQYINHPCLRFEKRMPEYLLPGSSEKASIYCNLTHVRQAM